MVEILALVLQHDEQAVLAAVELALEARPLYHHLCWRSMSNTRLLSIIKLSPGSMRMMQSSGLRKPM
jgi:hypothetical protein